jgi:hypothetical protein
VMDYLLVRTAFFIKRAQKNLSITVRSTANPRGSGKDPDKCPTLKRVVLRAFWVLTFGYS